MGNYSCNNRDKKTHCSQYESQIPEFTFGVQDIIKIKKRGLSNSYHICKRLGSGSYGDVYKAYNLETKVVRAIKKIPTQLLGNQFCILRQLDHPNILKIYEMFYEGEFSYIVTQFYEGGSLADLIAKRSYLNQTTALKLMFQILSGVNYLHSKNIIHGDLKPENILLDETQQKIYLADFGLAAYESKTECCPTGTKQFMAPDGSRLFCQKKFDIWACGVIMYLIFTGSLPPHNEKLQLDLQKSRWSDVTPEAKNLLLSLLCRDPQYRITAKQALFHSWFLKVRKQFYSGSMEWLRKMTENMRQNSNKNSMQRLIIFYIANFVIPKQKQWCFQYFTAFDRNLDGVITKEQLSVIFQKLDIHQDLDTLFHIIDSNNSGSIDYAQFLTFVSGSDKLLEDKSLEKAFGWIDQNSDHKISREELQQCLNGHIPNEAIDEIMHSCDTNNNGFIEYDEFFKFIKA